MTSAALRDRLPPIPRRARSIVSGYAYHVLNRANGRLRLFKKRADFAAFERVMEEAFVRVPLRILGHTLMSNHWHFVAWPRQRQYEQVSEFFRWLTAFQLPANIRAELSKVHIHDLSFAKTPYI